MRIGLVIVLIAVASPARPPSDIVDGAWVHTPVGRVAYYSDNCPCSTVLATYGEALPDSYDVVERS